LDKFQFYLPTRIIFEKGCLSRIGEVTSKYGKKCFLMTMGEFATKYGFTEYILEKISERELSVYLYDEVEMNPTEKGVNKITELFVDSGCDVIIAFGGGSVIDAAKAVSLLAKLGGKIGDYYFPNVVDKELYPIIAIPTTCGTGSEVTKYAIITEDGTGKKKTVLGDTLLPRVALLDSNTLKYLTKGIISSTGADVICHCIESFTSNKRSPFSDMFAVESAKVAFECLPKAFNGDEEAKERMLYASCLGGAAINTAGTTAAHALGYYLSSRYHIPHGVATVMFLPHIIDYEIEAIKERIEELSYGSRLNVPAEQFTMKLSEILNQVGVPKSLEELGIKVDDKDTIVQEGLSFRRNLENNPVKLEEKDLTTIVERAFKGR